jgi:hypothetical protein
MQVHKLFNGGCYEIMVQCEYPGSYPIDGIGTTNADTQLYVDLGPELLWII